jgi:hypothetical protein
MWSAAWRRADGLPDIVAVLGEWSIGPALHFSSIVAACSHILQALNAWHTHMSCRPMMALTLGALEMCERALRICEPCCIGRPVRLFFMFEAHDP